MFGRATITLGIGPHSSIETVEQVELFYRYRSYTLGLSYSVLQGNPRIFKNKGSFLQNVVPKA